MNRETSNKQSDEIQQIMMEAVRTQLAAVRAVTTFWLGWAQSADKYSQALSDELTKMTESGTTSKQDFIEVVDLTRAYLRELTELPIAAVRQFSNEIETLNKPKAKRTRSARAKE